MKKEGFKDDGRTIATMDFDRIPYGMPGVKLKKTQQNETINGQQGLAHETKLHLTKKERFALIIGLYQVIIPIVLLFVTLYFIAFLLLDIFWLK